MSPSFPRATEATRAEVVIERIVAGGFGLARTADGVALVRGAMPGERVIAGLRRAKGTLTGTVLEILDANPYRDPTPLPPGADLPLSYDAQIDVKEAIVRDALQRVGGIEADIQPLRRSPRVLNYRTAAQYGVLRDGGLGAHATGSRALVPIAEDALTAEPVAEAFRILSAQPMPGVRDVAIRGSLHEGRAVVGLLGEQRGPYAKIARRLVDAGIAGVAWGLRTRGAARFSVASKIVAGEGDLLEDFGGILTSVSARSFAQVNPPAAGLLYSEAVEIAGEGRRAIDLYAGSGVLALHLAGAFKTVDAVEISADAVKRGQNDARRLQAHGLTFRRGDARTVARYLPADLVAVNPPRAGIDADTTAALIKAAPPKILYVSCDPPTWSRDVGKMVAAGYRLTFARPYDFYPYTHHVEMLSLLETG
ncbi:MAG TPA: methyltransferase [Actinomycetota bacterium]|nr:methyltransferase [Actinomycetota bacterium]